MRKRRKHERKYGAKCAGSGACPGHRSDAGAGRSRTRTGARTRRCQAEPASRIAARGGKLSAIETKAQQAEEAVEAGKSWKMRRPPRKDGKIFRKWMRPWKNQ